MKKGAQYKFKTKGEKVQTPKGTGQYIYVTKPNTRFAEEGEAGHFEVTILLTQAQANPIIEKIEKIKAAAIAEIEEAKGKKPKVADDPYQTDEKTGLIKMKFKKPAVSKIEGKEVKNHVAVVDSQANVLPQDKIPNIGSGSTVKINGFLSPFWVPAVGVGVSLKLRGLQLIKLVEFGGQDDTNFDAEDDGYEFEAADADSDAGSEAGGAAGDTAGAAQSNDTPDF